MSNKKKSILFISGAFKKTGIGHVFRSVSLAEEFKQNVNPIFFVNENKAVIDYIGKNGFKYYTENLFDVIQNIKISAVIYDMYESEIGLLSSIKERYGDLLVFALDYFNYNNPPVDCIINLYNHNRNDKIPINVEYHEGVKHTIIRKSFDDYIKQNKKINKQVENILITFGGSDFSGHSVKVLKNLISLDYKKAKVCLIAGPIFSHIKEILSIVSGGSFDIEFLKNVSDIEKYMFKADLAFSGAGTTMMELCALGVPTIVIPQNMREKNFAEKFAQKEAVELCSGQKHNMLLKRIEKILNSYKKRKKLSVNAKNLIDGKGRIRIKNIVAKVINE